MKLEGWIAYDDSGEWVASNDRIDVVEDAEWVKGHDVTIKEIAITIPEEAK